MPLIPSLVAELREIHALHEEGVINQAEYDALKQGIIAKATQPAAPAAPQTPVPAPASAPNEVGLASPPPNQTISVSTSGSGPATPFTPSTSRQPDLLSMKGVYHVSGQTIGESESGKRASNKPVQRVEITRGRRRIVTAMSTPVFPCTKCGKRCKSKGALTNHAKIHGADPQSRGALGGGVRDYFGTSRARRAAQAARGSATPSRLGKPTITGLGTVYPAVWNILRKKPDRKQYERKRKKVQSGRGGEDRRKLNSGSKKRMRNSWAFKVCSRETSPLLPSSPPLSLLFRSLPRSALSPLPLR